MFVFLALMKRVYHLGKCNTCQRIISEVNWNFDRQEIRSEKISENQIDDMAKLAGSYQALFSKRAIKYRTLNLKEKTLTEQDYKNLILSDDTFLKRPVFVLDNQIFIGNSKAIIAALKIALNE
jgi:arsenate reductase-like glutaredoxin family protein